MRKSGMGTVPYGKIALIGAFVVFLVIGGFLLLERWEEKTGRFPEHEIGDPVVCYEGVEYVLKDNVETFLVLGLDAFDTDDETDAGTDSYNNDKHEDFLLVIVFDNDAKTYSAIQINRDTMVDINVLGVAGNKVDTVYGQISLAHTYGNGRDLSCHNTADAVSSLLMGMKINHYLSVTMDAVVTMNDLVGGVEVEVLDDFTGIDETLIKGQTVVLQGEQALTYVRVRKELEDSSNSARMERQRQYVRAMFEAFDAQAEGNEDFLLDATLKLGDHMVSDRSATQLQALAERLSDYEFLGVRCIEGESVRGEEFMEFYPEEASVKRMILDLFYKEK